MRPALKHEDPKMSEVYQRIDRCRIGGEAPLTPVMDLGLQSLTGVFPAAAGEDVDYAPIELTWCADSGLVQLAHNYDAPTMFGDNYGYRSGLNQSMVRHLARKVTALEKLVSVKSDDLVVDIGSNDATTLKSYQTPGLRKVGFDPTAEKFRQYYTPEIVVVADFFSAASYSQLHLGSKAKIVTSIAMFYDLPDPVAFAEQVEEILADDGVWHLEQSYLPAMLAATSYDTICHEHLEYYSLTVLKKIIESAGLKIIDVVQNDVNGGSFAVTAAKKKCSAYGESRSLIDWMIDQEARLGLHTVQPYIEFANRAKQHKDDLRRLVRDLVAEGRRVLGYGASTKGNVILQYCEFTKVEILAIADVNPDKFGRVTPGTHIPIVSEDEAHAMSPDFFLVLPWHFKNGILEREQAYRNRGGRFIFPFPSIEIV
jgi:hypothetical protein